MNVSGNLRDCNDCQKCKIVLQKLTLLVHYERKQTDGERDDMVPLNG